MGADLSSKAQPGIPLDEAALAGMTVKAIKAEAAAQGFTITSTRRVDVLREYTEHYQ